MRSRFVALLLCIMLFPACNRTPSPGGQQSSATSSPALQLSYEQVLELAQGGNHDAEFELGAMFHDGDGVEQDFAQALQWYKKAANGGNRQAMFNLGMMYKNGEGIPADLSATKVWFVRSSDAGDVRAALQLGTMAYAEKNFTTAMQYFLKAAKSGLAEAQMNAGVMYIRGEGVPEQDVIEGYAWLTLAMEGENSRAASMRESLSAKMTEEQKAKGNDRVLQLRKDIIVPAK